MRSILILTVVLCFQLQAQDANKAARTAGSEFLDKNKQEQNQSITSNTTYTEFITTKVPGQEKILVSPKGTMYTSDRTTSNSIVYIIAFLMAGIAFFFITQNRKNKMVLRNEIHLEGEEEEIRKKELWDAMAEPETE